MVNAEVERGASESNANLLRRFSRRVQESSVLKRARAMRYYERPYSETLQKQRKMNALKRREHFEELAKLGKLPERKGRRR